MNPITSDDGRLLGYIKPHPAMRRGVSAALDGFGGILRCETCHTTAVLGDPGQRVTGQGWPKCCGYTMRWWTQRQIDAGEMDASS